MLPDFLERFAPQSPPLTRREIRAQQQEKARRDFEHSQHRGRNRFLRGVGLALMVATAVIVGQSGGISPARTDWSQIDVQRETLEQMVEKARQLEDGFRGTDLSDKSSRDQYTWLIAGIFDKHFPSSLSREQLSTAIILVEDRDEFFRLYSQPNNLSSSNIKGDKEKLPGGFTRGKIAYIDLHNTAFQLRNIRQDRNFPRNWNPLKSLRAVEIHEYFHLIVIPNSQDRILTYLDPSGKSFHKRVKGFQIENISIPNANMYDDFNEAATELLSILTNNA